MNAVRLIQAVTYDVWEVSTITWRRMGYSSCNLKLSSSTITISKADGSPHHWSSHYHLQCPLLESIFDLEHWFGKLRLSS